MTHCTRHKRSTQITDMKTTVHVILTVLVFVCHYLSPAESQTPASNPVLAGNTFLTHAVEAKFACTSYGNPTPQISWKLENNNILQGFSTETVPIGNNRDNVTSVLTFLPIYADDGQRLYCIVRQNGVFSDLSTFVTLTISFTVATRLYQVLSGNTVTITCIVRSVVPLSEVYWRKTSNGIISTIGSSLVQGSNKYGGVTLNDASLTIYNIDYNDDGSYVCYAQTNTGSGASSEAATLSIITITVGNTLYSATEGDRVTLECSVIGLSSYTITWYKDNQIVNTANSRFQNGDSTTPSLTINPVAVSDAGTYICSLSSGGSSSNSSAISLSIQVSDIITVTLPTTQYSVYTGNSAILQCDVQSTSLVSAVYWVKTSGGNTQYIYSSSLPSKYAGGSPSTPSLTIYNVDLNDAGSYVCFALTSSGLTGQSANSAILNVIASLATVTASQLYYTKTVGEYATLDCNIASSGQTYTVTWYFNGAVLGISGRYTGAVYGNPSLSIYSVQSSDAGSYICSATTSGGSRNGSTISLNVLQPATFTIPTFYYSSTVGDDVTLQCDINSGTQSYTVTWYYNGAYLGVSGRFSGAVYGSPSLRITNVQSNDGGSYICSATTSAGTSNSSTITLYVQQVPLATVTVPTSYYTYSVGDLVVLECNVYSNSQPYTVTWYFNNAILSIFGRFTGAVYGNPSLSISSLQSSDGGSYICSATTSGGSRNGSTITLNVLQRATFTTPTLYYSSAVGDDVTLQCDINSGTQSYTVTWYYNGAYLGVSGRFFGATYGSPSLRITNVQSSDGGSYICSATTSAGTSNSSAITLYVQQAIPIMSVTSISDSYSIGENVTLYCQVNSGNSVYNITWYHDNAVVTVTGRWSGGSYGNPSLTITDIQMSDSGSYICSASNSGGASNSSTLNLNVLELLPVVTVSTYFYQRTVSGSVTLQCSVDSSGQSYSVSWYFNNGVLFLSSRITGGTYLNPSLTITNIQSSDAGSYICSASTSGGTRNSSLITLGVENPLPTVSIPTNYYGASVGENLTLVCGVDASGNSYSVNWYFNNGFIANSGRISGGFYRNPSLTITNAQTSDTGTYICSATTGAGSRNGTSISVSVQDVIPTISVSTFYYNPSLGDTLTLVCSVQAYNSPYTVTWFYNNAVRITSIGRYSGGIYGSPSLTISNVQSSDTGTYICSASTSAGSRNSSAISVNVQQILPTISISTYFYQPQVGEIITLDCDVFASGQTYTVTWYYNSAVLVTNTGRYSGATYGNPSLTISNVQTADTGSYICSAATSAGSRNGTTITVNIQQVFAVVTVNSNFYQPQVGETVTLNCNVQASGQTYTVTWYYNNGFLNTNTGRYSGGIYGNPSVTITNAQSSDTGSYICSAATSAGSRNSTTISLNVQQVLPTVTVPTNFYQPRVNELVNMECTVQASGQAYTVTWYYNGVILNTNTGRYSGGIYGNPTLTITNAQTSDTGSYICSASTSAGQRNATTISLNVQQVLPTVTVSTYFYQPKVAETVTLQCDVQASGQTYSVQWYFNTANLVTNSGRYSGATYGTPSLIISNVQTSDTGSYICSAATSAGSRNGSTISVNVQQSLPTVTVTTFFYQPKVAETITLDCSVQASGQTYTVQWYYNNVVLVTNTGRYTGAAFGNPSLTITNVQTSDTGSYICSAATSAGSRNGSTISVNVQQILPTVTVLTYFYQPNLGETVTLECSVQASSQTYTVQWYYNNALLTSNSGRFSGGIYGNPSLTITNAQISDSGSYVCSAATSAGSRNATTISLNVQATLPTVTVPSVYYNPKVTDSVTLDCSVQASGQTYTVQWYYNTGLLTSNFGRYSGGISGNPSLTISSVQISDSGSYVCSAATSGGSRNSSTISVSVQQIIPTVTVPAVYYNPRISETVTLDCNVQASGQTYTVTWYYNTALLTSNTGRYSGGIYGNPSLTINSVQVADTGSYVCSAATSAGSRNASAISVTVQATLPSVSVNSFFYQPKVTETVTIDCSVQSSGQTYTVTWYYNNAILNINTAGYSGGTYGSPSLTISDVQTSDSGTYVCSAATSAGSRNSSTVTVTVQQILPTVSVPSVFYQPKVRDSVTLDCTVVASGQTYTVTWFYNNAVLNTNTGRYSGGVFGTPSLTLSTVASSDSGSYICSAATAAGSRNATSIAVNVQQILPTMTVPVNFYTPKYGDSVSLDCSVQAYGQSYTVTWYYNNAMLPVSGRFSGGSSGSPALSISSLQLSDTGSYICSAATAAGSRNGTTISLNVQEILPTVTVSQNFYQPNGGESVTLDCTVDSSGLSYTITWYYNSAILSTNTGRYTGGSFGSPSLTIRNSQISDSGSYICSAVTAAGSRNSSTISVTVQQSLPTISVFTNYYQPVVGTAVTLNCTVSVLNGVSSYTVTWYYNGAVLPITGRFTGGYYGNPSLAITNVQKSDDGSYICSASNVGGSRNSSIITLNVLQYAPQNVIITPSTLTVDEGNTISLRCNATGSPPPTFSWSQGQRSWTGQLLNIQSSSSADEAVYSCTATNAAGNRTATAAVFVHYVPRVNIPSYSYTGIQGQSLMIPCTYASSPAAYSITWTKTVNGQTQDLVIPGTNNKYSGGRFTGSSGYANLTINNLEVIDEGTYKCSVTNTKGTGSSIDTSLRISYAPQNIAISPSSLITEPEFSNVRMRCTADASPAPVFTWTHGTEIYTGATLSFDNAPRARNGVYTCRAVNSVGTSTATVYLNLQYSPDIISTTSESRITTSIGSSVRLDCKTDANPVASLYEWTFGSNTFTRTEPELIISVTSSSFGDYRCKASNNLGVSASHIYTVLQTSSGTDLGNTGQSTASAGYSGGEIAAIIIAVLFILLIIIIIGCCCYHKGVCSAMCGKKEAKGQVKPEPIVECKIEIPRFHEVPSVHKKYPSREPSFVSRQDVDVAHIKEEEFEINTSYRLVPPSSTMGGTIISLKDGHSPRGKLPALEHTYDEQERKQRRKKRKKRRHHRESGEGMESSPRPRRLKKRDMTENIYVNGDTYQTVYEEGDLVVEPGPNSYFYNDYDA